MRAIGFSTGALAKGDFRRGLELNRGAGAVHAVELSALREGELFALVDAVTTLDLSGFNYVSFHAPSVLRELDEQAVVDALMSLPENWPVIAHPEILTSDVWQSLGARLCIENMDNRKTTGRTVSEMAELLSRFPQAGFCLDVGHARQVDPTMNVAVAMLRLFADRLRQLHVSEVGPRGEHLPLSRLAQLAFTRVARFVPADCPIIIESIVAEGRIRAELDIVAAVFAGANVEELRELVFG